MKIAGWLFVFLSGVAIASCGSRRHTPVAEERGETADRVAVDAYLFDARIWRDGKPTSFRLEMYRADTIIGLAGRGYLGKGALKGKITRDSMLVYFPSSNEFLREPVKKIVGTFECAPEVAEPKLLGLVDQLPEQWIPGSGYDLKRQESDDDEREYLISQPDCQWRLIVRYDLKDDGWHLERLDYDDRDRVQFTADRRTLKTGTDVALKRFQTSIPVDAARIIP